MNNAELVSAVAQKLGFTQVQVRQVLDTATEVKTDALSRGDEIKVAEFGTFKIVRSEQRKGRNPATGEEITIAASKRVKFVPVASLKDKVNR